MGALHLPPNVATMAVAITKFPLGSRCSSRPCPLPLLLLLATSASTCLPIKFHRNSVVCRWFGKCVACQFVGYFPLCFSLSLSDTPLADVTMHHVHCCIVCYFPKGGVAVYCGRLRLMNCEWAQYMSRNQFISLWRQCYMNEVNEWKSARAQKEGAGKTFSLCCGFSCISPAKKKSIVRNFS